MLRLCGAKLGIDDQSRMVASINVDEPINFAIRERIE
jgi:hypothetical protein